MNSNMNMNTSRDTELHGRGDARPVEAHLAALHVEEANHPFWRNRLFRALRAGHLQREDLRLVFSQYHLYSKNFSRYIAAVMANSDNDYFRARLSQNLWDEGGGIEPEKRHAEIFRKFLRDGLDVDPDAIVYAPYARHFVQEYLSFCLRSDATAGAAFLSLGTESIVPRMYQIFLQGLREAGLPEDSLTFFEIHIECDDAHADTLVDMMASESARPGWFDACRNAMNTALELRRAFFENLFDAIQAQRLAPLLERIQDKRSLVPDDGQVDGFRHRPGEAAPSLYRNEDLAKGIEFSVDRLPLPGEVLDPRMVLIPPGRANENHRHAHETLMYFLCGEATVRIDGQDLEVRAGDAVLVPRWSQHQTRNTGSSEVRFLAVTDFRLTERAFLGDAEAYRARRSR